MNEYLTLHLISATREMFGAQNESKRSNKWKVLMPISLALLAGCGQIQTNCQPMSIPVSQKVIDVPAGECWVVRKGRINYDPDAGIVSSSAQNEIHCGQDTFRAHGFDQQTQDQLSWEPLYRCPSQVDAQIKLSDIEIRNLGK